MEKVTSLGRYIFAVPFLVFGLFHFMKANDMAAMSFIGVSGVYLSGAGLVAGAISMFIGKYDKLASLLMAVLLLLFIATIHAPGLSDPSNQTAMGGLLKDLGLLGGCLMYAHAFAKDNSVVG
ncbi:MAG: DoxX family protein [Bacteroidia bacterium]